MKAFDTMSHERLLYKISRYGIKDPLHGWIRSLFNNRLQCAIINGYKSESVPAASGIPRGSVLGQLLFVTYIDDLPDGIKSIVCIFANDANTY